MNFLPPGAALASNPALPMNRRELTSRSWAAAAVAFGTLVVANGCRGEHSALNPAGPQAEAIRTLSWWLIAVSGAVWIGVIVFLGIALFRRRVEPTAESDRKTWSAIGAGVAATVVILIVLLVMSAVAGNRISRLTEEDPLTIDVIGRRWWWEVIYHHPSYRHPVTSANEIHIPAGRPVRLRLTSHDVIHSLWVPRLHGKMDLTPGHTTELWIQADDPGVYRGQCAEFCGIQHALMALLVVSMDPEEYERWFVEEQRPAPAPVTPSQQRGLEVFRSSGCPSCHSVRGVVRGGEEPGPDLTHFGRRRTIAAATLPNQRGPLAGWILDSQSTKPGNLMPRFHIPAEDLAALLDYLESLQ
jgi:cytochrome c oxidase subunit II